MEIRGTRIMEKGQTPETLPPQPWQKIWRTIKIGIGPRSGQEFVVALENAGHRVSNWAKQLLLLPAFTVAKEEQEIPVALVSTAELGFPEGTGARQIFKKFEEHNLWLPAEVGPQSRLQYADQPMGEWLRVAMKPFADSGGDPYVFDLGRNSGGRWLSACYANPEYFWGPAHSWLVRALASVGD